MCVEAFACPVHCLPVMLMTYKALKLMGRENSFRCVSKSINQNSNQGHNFTLIIGQYFVCVMCMYRRFPNNMVSKCNYLAYKSNKCKLIKCVCKSILAGTFLPEDQDECDLVQRAVHCTSRRYRHHNPHKEESEDCVTY